MKIKNLSILLLGVMLASLAQAASYSTLPKNVNTLVFKQVIVSKIESQYDSKGQVDTLDFKEEFTSSRLEDISNVIKNYFEQLHAISPQAYSDFSLGEFSADVFADVSAQGFGYGYGITDRLTIYASIPIYHIVTDIKFKQTKASNIIDVQNAIKNAPTDTPLGKFIKDLTMQLPNTNAELLQSLVVNYYGYKPVGKWKKDALGDSEIGLIYRLTNFPDKGLALSAGAVLPTGEADDPDSLQDVATGDGQYDTFIEAAAGVSFIKNMFQIDIKSRYTYQFESDKEIRWIEDKDLPLATSKRHIKEKLGNKIDTILTLTFNPTYWVNLNSSLIVYSTDSTKYTNISDTKTRIALESKTDSKSRWVRIGLGFSTIEAFQRKKFYFPMDLGLSAQRLINAKNTHNYDRLDLDFKLYF